MIGGEILRDHGGGVRSIGDGNSRVLRQSHDECFQVIPLAGYGGIQGIVDQNGQA
jgi:hypothetical protein